MKRVLVDQRIWMAILMCVSISDGYGQMFASPVEDGFVVTRSFMQRGLTARHTGVDLANPDQPEGAAVYAIADGVVVHRQDETTNTGWGHMLRIQHDLIIDGQPFSFYSQYAHLQAGSLLVTQNETVSRGQMIAKVDCTGRTEGNVPCANGQFGPHLHLEIKLIPSSVSNTDGCGYLPSSNCPGDSFANYFDPLPFIMGRVVYISSFSEGRIYLVDKKSAAKLPVISGLGFPEDLAIDTGGRLYVGGVFQGIKRVDTSSYSLLSNVGSNVCGPEGPGLSSDGLLVVNTRLGPCQHSGLWIIPDGVAVTAVQITAPFSGWGEGTAFLTASPFAGDLIAADSSGGRIVRIPRSDFGNLIKQPNLFTSGLCVPVGLAVNDGGEIFVSDTCSQEIRKYAPDGTFNQVFASFAGPLFLEFDSNGDLYVTSFDSGTARFSPNGSRAILFPGGPVWGVDIPGAVGIAVRDD